MYSKPTLPKVSKKPGLVATKGRTLCILKGYPCIPNRLFDSTKGFQNAWTSRNLSCVLSK
jgi:hypothetical protein